MIYAIALLHAVFLLTLLLNVFYLRRGRKRRVPEVYPTVSILVPARNEEANLRRLLPSVLGQDYPAFEVIVYDDGSEDGTWEVLQALDDARVKAFQGTGPPPGLQPSTNVLLGPGSFLIWGWTCAGWNANWSWLELRPMTGMLPLRRSRTWLIRLIR